MKKEVQIYICDDNQFFLEEIEQRTRLLIGKNRFLNIQTFNTGRELIKSWNEAFADVVFLDIDMPELNGFEVAERLQKIKKNVLIIFITSHEDKVYQSWKYQPFWFVRKSHIDDLDVVLPRLLTKIDAEHEKERNVYNLQGENCVVELDINSLMYIESFKHDIIIYNKNDKQQVRCKISDAEQQLLPFNIIRVQNGVLVNCRFISKITSRDVILINGDYIHLSRERSGFVKNEYQKFLRSRHLW